MEAPVEAHMDTWTEELIRKTLGKRLNARCSCHPYRRPSRPHFSLPRRLTPVLSPWVRTGEDDTRLEDPCGVSHGDLD